MSACFSVLGFDRLYYRDHNIREGAYVESKSGRRLVEVGHVEVDLASAGIGAIKRWSLKSPCLLWWLQLRRGIIGSRMHFSHLSAVALIAAVVWQPVAGAEGCV